MTIKTDKVVVENGADFTFVCRKVPFSISCSEIYNGDTNLVDLDLVNKMRIPLRNIRVTRMSLLGHDVRAVGRIKQTVQCVVNGRIQGNVHLEGKVVRDLYSLLSVDCLASSKTYERLMGRKPPDPSDEGYESTEDIPTLGGEEEVDSKEEKEEEGSKAKDHQKTEEEVPPDPPDQKNPPAEPRARLNAFQHEEWPNFMVIETEGKDDNADDTTPVEHGDIFADFKKFGPGPRDLIEMKLNSMHDEEDEDEDEQHCDLCFREGKPLKVVTNHSDNCPTCPSLTPNQKLRIHGSYWKQQAEMIFKMRYNRERGKE